MATFILKQQLFNELQKYFTNNTNFINLRDYIDYLINKYINNLQINNLHNIVSYLNNIDNTNLINDIYTQCHNFDIEIIEHLLLFFNPNYISIYELNKKLAYISIYKN
jgi:hypothetical protein